MGALVPPTKPPQMPPPRTPPQAQAEWPGADVREGKSGFLVVKCLYRAEGSQGCRWAEWREVEMEGQRKEQWYEPFFVSSLTWLPSCPEIEALCGPISGAAGGSSDIRGPYPGQVAWTGAERRTVWGGAGRDHCTRPDAEAVWFQPILGLGLQRSPLPSPEGDPSSPNHGTLGEVGQWRDQAGLLTSWAVSPGSAWEHLGLLFIRKQVTIRVAF